MVNGKNFYYMNHRCLWDPSETKKEEEEVFSLSFGALWSGGVRRLSGILRLPEPQQW